jgi:glycerol-3-phosphate dehydrogenase
LLEQHDFAKGTSSRSTKLIHGGVRYLRQGNLSLVMEALRERGLLMQNAPSLVHSQAFVIPNYGHWDRIYYGLGLRFYDALAGRLGIGTSRSLTRAETLALIPNLQSRRLRGATLYYDAQFDDARLAIALVQTLIAMGAVPLNYLRVHSLRKQHGRVKGVVAVDTETSREYELDARVVINATGVFSDSIRRMDQPSAHEMITPSQGIHIVVDHKFLPSRAALMVPQTSDGRILFAIPWLDRVLIGTTDTPVTEIQLEPRPMHAEIEYLLRHLAHYLGPVPGWSDIRSAFAGLRPLVKTSRNGASTSQLSREHHVLVSESGLVSVLGGKWTTFRKMAADVVDRAREVGQLPRRQENTERLPLDQHSCRTAAPDESSTHYPPLDPRLPYTQRDVAIGVRYELARTLEDVLSRRTRALLLDAEASIDIAPQVAEWMSAELGKSREWVDSQIAMYRELACRYLPQGRCAAAVAP